MRLERLATSQIKLPSLVSHPEPAVPGALGRGVKPVAALLAAKRADDVRCSQSNTSFGARSAPIAPARTEAM